MNLIMINGSTYIFAVITTGVISVIFFALGFLLGMMVTSKLESGDEK